MDNADKNEAIHRLQHGQADKLSSSRGVSLTTQAKERLVFLHLTYMPSPSLEMTTV